MISIVHVSVVVGVVIIVIVVIVVIFVIMISIVVVGVVIAATCGFGVRGLMNDDLLLPSSFFLTVPCNARIRVCNQPTIAAASAGRQWRGPGASGRHWQGEDDDGDGGDDDDGWMLNASRWRLEPQAKKKQNMASEAV